MIILHIQLDFYDWGTRTRYTFFFFKIVKSLSSNALSSWPEKHSFKEMGTEFSHLTSKFSGRRRTPSHIRAQRCHQQPQLLLNFPFTNSCAVLYSCLFPSVCKLSLWLQKSPPLSRQDEGYTGLCWDMCPLSKFVSKLFWVCSAEQRRSQKSYWESMPVIYRLIVKNKHRIKENKAMHYRSNVLVLFH